MTALQVLFPTTACTRYSGTAQYSWCVMYDSTCFQCGGTGLAWATRRVENAVAAHRETRRVAHHPPAKGLCVGEVVTADL